MHFSLLYIFPFSEKYYLSEYINNVVAKKTTEVVLLFHKKTTKLVFLWPNMSQKNIKVLILKVLTEKNNNIDQKDNWTRSPFS